VSIYPLVRYLRAFDVNVSAAGYNTCCEVLQAGVPTLFVPNTLVADDQARRAALVAEASPAVVSPCETDEQQARAVEQLLALVNAGQSKTKEIALNGAERAAEELLALIDAT
jgi:predicted glycosyltransferase